jgi:putative tricarboxylic transport membrane protein
MGLLSLTVGLFIGLIGLARLSGAPRCTFGSLQLLDRVDVVIVIVRLFAIGETLHVASKFRSTPERSCGSGTSRSRPPHTGGEPASSRVNP